jgi:hypothetical protein
MKEILSMLHYCVCDLLRKGPYRRLILPFGSEGHARDYAVAFFLWGGWVCKRLYVVMHDAFGASPLCLRKSHPQFNHRSQDPNPFINCNRECGYPPFSIMQWVTATHVFNKVSHVHHLLS